MSTLERWWTEEDSAELVEILSTPVYDTPDQPRQPNRPSRPRRDRRILWAALAIVAFFGFRLAGSPAPFSISGERPVLLPPEESSDATPSDPAPSDDLAVGGVLAIGETPQSFAADGRVEVAAETPPPAEPAPIDPATLAAFGRIEVDPVQLTADENLALIKAASVRNRNHDSSPYINTPSSELVLQNHYGPRSDYLGNPAGNPERSFPVPQGGQFRTTCEFSHFAYDDPLVHPNQPGAAHLHMFFGNTNTNAFTTYDSLLNSGSSTCNGQELNRTGYWAPAMFDGNGNVRIPERVMIYYKGEGQARGKSEVYPAGAAMIATENLNTAPNTSGGVAGKKFTYLCTDNFSSPSGNGSQTMANCNGNKFGNDRGRWTVLEMNVKFPQCWNGQDPSDISNFAPPSNSGWYGSNCGGEFSRTLPNLEYFINYRVEPGEDTSQWFLSSDVSPVSFDLGGEPRGATAHADWWGAWHPDVNRMWIDNCVNYRNGSTASGCGNGYLTDGGPNGKAPKDGPALKFRPQYDGPQKVAASTLLAELCPATQRQFTKATDAAYCTPGAHTHGD